MGFPTDPLDITVSLAIGADLSADPATWSWTDVTPRIREVNKINITRGRRSRVGQVAPTRCTAVASNPAGDLSRQNPYGQYYGQLKKNTPMKVEVDNGSGPVIRAAVFVPGFPPSWAVSGANQTVTLSGVGIMDRLGRGKKLLSPSRRSTQRLAPVRYWPLEDASGATAGGSAVPKIAAAFINPWQGSPDPNANVQFGVTDDTAPAGATAAARLSYGWGLAGRLPGGSVSAVTFACWMTPVDDSFSHATLTIRFGGQIRQLAVAVRPFFDDVSIAVAYSDGTVASAASSPIAGLAAGVPHHVAVTMVTSGADVDYEVYLDGVSVYTVTDTASSMANPTHLTVCNDYQGSVPVVDDYQVTASGLAYWDRELTPTEVADLARAGEAWVGEQAHERVERLCGEESVRVAVTATRSTPMGPQTTDGLLAQLRDCAAADLGVLSESMDFGLAYRASSERYNLSPAITLQYDRGHIAPPWEPDDDDQEYLNEVSATRPGGSLVVVSDQDDIDEVGTYGTSISPNVETDNDAANVASVMLQQGLNDELTWPAVKPNLFRSSALLDAWMAAGLGDQMHITGHPSPLAPDTIRQVIEGYSEVIANTTYTATAILSPAEIYTVGVYGADADARRYNSRYSTLSTSYNSSATSLVVNIASGPLWIRTATHPARFPFDITIGGLVYSCTAITGSSSPQTFTVVRLAHDKALPSGSPVHVYTPSRYAL